MTHSAVKHNRQNLNMDVESFIKCFATIMQIKRKSCELRAGLFNFKFRCIRNKMYFQNTPSFLKSRDFTFAAIF